MGELRHTVAVVFEQQRPVAGVNSRRRGLWLDNVGIGVRLYKRHCGGCGGSYGAIGDVVELEVFRTFAGINFATSLACANAARAASELCLASFHRTLRQ
jgi:hypothetical protein